MKTWCIRATVLVASLPLTLNGQDVQSLIAPAGAEFAEGSSNTVIPLIAPSIRYQQIYSASNFAALKQFGGGWIMLVYFRGDGMTGAGGGVNLTSAQINLSTTARSPLDLSSNFSANLGLDDTILFGPGRLEGNVFGSRDGQPQPFDFLLNLTRTFYYNPSGGNLLLDFRIFQGDDYSNPDRSKPVLDLWGQNDGLLARVYWGDVNAVTGEVSRLGLPTQFYFWPNPQLTVHLTNGTVSLTWPVNPSVFVLQSSPQLSSLPGWTNVTNGVVTSDGVRRYEVSPEMTASRVFYRLYSATNTSPP